MSRRDPGTITRVLNRQGHGDPDAVYQRIYNELRAISHRRLAGVNGECGSITPTVLVNEAWVKLADQQWESRAHFFGAAARAMRQVLVDQARRQQSAKRNGRVVPLQAEHAVDEPALNPVDLLVLDEALNEMQQVDGRSAELVELRFFAGLSINDAAAALGISERTANRDWRHARAWLYERLKDACHKP